MTIRQHAAAAAALALLLAPLALFAQETKKLTDSSVPATVSIADADYLYVVQGGVSKRGTAGQLRAVTDTHVANDLTIESSATIGTDSCVRIGDRDAATNAVQICRSTADDRLYHDTDADGTKDTGEEFIDASGGGMVRLPSLSNPPASPHAYDCEFDDGVMGCSGWSISTGTLTSGTVAPFSSLTDPIYDTASWDGWLLVQSDEISATLINAAQKGSISPDTDSQWIFRVFSSGSVSVTNEGRSGICLQNSSDANEAVCAGFHTAGASERIEIYCNNDGVVTSTDYGTVLPSLGATDFVFVLQKVSDQYYLYPLNPSGGGWHGTLSIQSAATCAKTGVTSFDTISWVVATANETPSRFMGIDFIRYRAGSGLPPMNP